MNNNIKSFGSIKRMNEMYFRDFFVLMISLFLRWVVKVIFVHLENVLILAFPMNDT